MSNPNDLEVTENKKKPVSEEVGLKYLWSILSTFTVLYILQILLLDRTNELLIDMFHFDDTWESAPVFALTFGTLISIGTFSLMLVLIKKSKAKEGLSRVPPLWIDIDVKSGLGRAWRRIVLVLVFIFPLAAQLHFWLRLFEWQVWKDTAAAPTVSLWSYVSPSYFLDWDAHRYGDHSKRMLEEGFGGVSFLPFWQPLIMAGMTLFLLIITGKIILALSHSKSS